MLFKREIELVIDGLKYTYPDFTIYFRVNFDDDPDANDARIEIYNLSADSTNRIKKNGQIILNAGYEGDIGTIFGGIVDSVQTDRQMATDKITTIQATDNEHWRGQRVNKTYKGRRKGSEIIRDVLAQTGFEIGAFTLPNDKDYWNKPFNTSALDVITRIARDCGAKVHNHAGRVFIRPAGEGSQLAFQLNADTGLVDTPERIDDEQVGWNVKSLLNHRVGPDSLFTINSSTANGNFRVRKGQHIADRTRFYTVVEVVG